VFREDGTFVIAFRVEPQALQSGSRRDLVGSEDVGQEYVFVADGANSRISTLDRQSGEPMAACGRAGQSGRLTRHRGASSPPQPAGRRLAADRNGYSASLRIGVWPTL
jgi:hypothetical protein